jgi:hypothetical protein
MCQINILIHNLPILPIDTHEYSMHTLIIRINTHAYAVHKQVFHRKFTLRWFGYLHFRFSSLVSVGKHRLPYAGSDEAEPCGAHPLQSEWGSGQGPQPNGERLLPTLSPLQDLPGLTRHAVHTLPSELCLKNTHMCRRRYTYTHTHTHTVVFFFSS